MFSSQYPWQWRAAEVEAFVDHLRSGPRPIVASTARTYLCELRLFLEYVTDSRYGWPAQCLDRFGTAPQQVLGEWNTLAHVTDYEGRPGRRPLTYEEVQALFDAADGLVEEFVPVSGRARTWSAMRCGSAIGWHPVRGWCC